nr:hypothetical protein [Pseudofrankia sp. DC12]
MAERVGGLPVVFWSSWIFFDGAMRAVRARTLDMMVLVAIGTGWVYSLVVTLTGGGEVFYEAAALLAAFVLLAALAMSGSSVLVAVNAVLLKRLRLPHTVTAPGPTTVVSARTADLPPVLPAR